MAIFNTMRDFFIDGTVIPATDVDQLKQEIKKNNDFKNSDLLKDVIEINNVLGVESHPKSPEPLN